MTRLALLAILALAAPPALAAIGEFGSFVGPDDADATQAFIGAAACVLGPAGAATCFAFLDTDGDGAFDTNETAYLDLDGDAIADRFELRLTPLGTMPAFSQVRPADLDSGEALTVPAAAQLAFYDADGNAGWSREDSFYADMDGGGRVTPGDIRLTATPTFPGGTRVATGDADERNRLAVPAAVPTLAFTDFDGSTGFNLGDGLYVDQDGAAPPALVVYPEDLRMTRVGSLAPGRVVLPADTDVTPVLLAVGGTPVFGFDDENGNGAFDQDEAFYLLDLTDADVTVEPGDIRLTPRFGQAAGGSVRPTDADAGFVIPPAAQRAFAGAAGVTALAYYDSEGDGGWSLRDWVYVDTDLSASVSPGDVRLNPSPAGAAGTRVLSEAADENRPLISAATGFAAALTVANLGILDADNSGALNLGDTVYLLQLTGSTSPRQEDLRLSALGTTAPAGSFVLLTDPDQTVRATGPLAAVFAYLDDNGNGAFDQGEMMFLDGLRGAAGAVSFGDMVISPGNGGEAPGTQLLGSDPRIGSTLVAVGGSARVFLYDTDGDSFWSVTDRLVLDVDGNGLVSAGDVRLTAQGSDPAGSRVRSGSADEGRTLVAVAGLALALYDADVSGAGFTLCDQVYLQPAFLGPGTIRVEDFRLGGNHPSCPQPAVPPSTSTTRTTSAPTVPPVTDAPITATTPSPTTVVDPPEPTGADPDRRTGLPAALGALAVAGAALAMRRRL